MARMIVAMMGVSGSGKTTIARAVAARLGWAFQEGDELHPPANVAKMAAGIPLDDADRLPWLRKVAAWVEARRAAGEPGVVTCSLLKRSYRELVIDGREGVRLMYLRGAREVIGERMAHRSGHFMPAGLLDSQFATLEPPLAEERPLVVDVDGPAEAIIAEALRQIDLA